jgi:protein-tyrosine kinase
MTDMPTDMQDSEVISNVPDADMSRGEVVAAGGGGFAFSTRLFPLTRSDSAEGETIAALRNYLIGQHVRDGRRSLAVCGPTAGVGCTFISVNLAVAMAQAGVNTLLIDANLRDPSVDQLITPASPSPGLRDYLTDGGNAPPHICSQVLPRLSVLYAGGASTQAQELLATTKFKQLLDESLRAFDLTIVDCPPSANYSDARRTASLLRHALVVARRDHSFAADIRTLVGELQSDRVKVVGTFLNAFA